MFSQSVFILSWHRINPVLEQVNREIDRAGFHTILRGL